MSRRSRSSHDEADRRMKPPLISVIMPAYNCGPYVEAAVKSVLSQTYGEFELLAIDDGSTDDTAEKLAALAQMDSRIRFVSQENRGISATLNRAVDLGQGELMARMDADDLCHPERFERQVAFLSAHPEIGIVGSWIRLFGARNETWHYRMQDAFIKFLLLFRTNGFGHNAIMGRMPIFREFRYDSAFDAVEDADLWCRIATRSATGFANIPEVLMQYRIHAEQSSSLRRAHQLALYEIIMKQFMLALGVEDETIDAEAHRWCCDITPGLSVAQLMRARGWLKRLASGIRPDWHDEFGVLAERWARLCVANDSPVLAADLKFRPTSWLCARPRQP